MDVPPEADKGFEAIRSLTGGFGGMLMTAGLARVLWHHRLVRLGQRRFWSRDLVWEVPTAIFSAIVGSGVAEILMPHIADAVRDDPARLYTIGNCIVGVSAWLGPRGTEVLLGRIVAKYFPQSKGGDHDRVDA